MQVTETYYVIKFYIVLKQKMNKYSHLKVKSVWVLLWTLFNFFFLSPLVQSVFQHNISLYTYTRSVCIIYFVTQYNIENIRRSIIYYVRVENICTQCFMLMENFSRNCIPFVCIYFEDFGWWLWRRPWEIKTHIRGFVCYFFFFFHPTYELRYRENIFKQTKPRVIKLRFFYSRPV